MEWIIFISERDNPRKTRSNYITLRLILCKPNSAGISCLFHFYSTLTILTTADRPVCAYFGSCRKCLQQNNLRCWCFATDGLPGRDSLFIT